jgi:hypothetical protein
MGLAQETSDEQANRTDEIRSVGRRLSLVGEQDEHAGGQDETPVVVGRRMSLVDALELLVSDAPTESGSNIAETSFQGSSNSAPDAIASALSDYEFPTAAGTESGVTLPEPGAVTCVPSGRATNNHEKIAAALAAELDDYNHGKPPFRPSSGDSSVAYSQASEAWDAGSSDYMVVNLADNDNRAKDIAADHRDGSSASSVSVNNSGADDEYMVVNLADNGNRAKDIAADRRDGGSASSVSVNNSGADDEYIVVNLNDDAAISPVPPNRTTGNASVAYGDVVAETRFNIGSADQGAHQVASSLAVTPGKVEVSAQQDSTLVQTVASQHGAVVPPSDIPPFTIADIGKRCKAGSNQGVIRFVGIHAVHGLPRVGVELDAPRGKNNGTVKGDKYFECTMMHGKLCKPDRIVLIDTDSDALTLNPAPVAKSDPPLSAMACTIIEPTELRTESETDNAINPDATGVSRPGVDSVDLLVEDAMMQPVAADSETDTPTSPPGQTIAAAPTNEGAGVGERQVDNDGIVNSGGAEDATPEVHSSAQPPVLELEVVGNISTDAVPIAGEKSTISMVEPKELTSPPTREPFSEEGGDHGSSSVESTTTAEGVSINAAELISNSIWSATEGAAAADGLMSASAVADRLKASGLSKTVLRTVWSGAKAITTTKSSAGTMNKEEFEIACRLALEAGAKFL